MSVSNLPIFPQTLTNWSVPLVNANGTSTIALVVGATNGSKVESIIATSNNASDLSLNLWVNLGLSDVLLASVLVPANSGGNTLVATVDVLGNSQVPGVAQDPNGNQYLYIASGTTLKVSANTVGAGKVLGVFASGGNY